MLDMVLKMSKKLSYPFVAMITANPHFSIIFKPSILYKVELAAEEAILGVIMGFNALEAVPSFLFYIFIIQQHFSKIYFLQLSHYFRSLLDFVL